jgi:putative endopeptidase
MASGKFSATVWPFALLMLSCGSTPPTATATASKAVNTTALVAVAATPSPKPTTAPFGASNATISNVSLADVGLEASSLDKTVDPCVDFFQFSCGGWVANNPIPADKSGWGRFEEVAQRNEKSLHELFDAAVVAAKKGDKASMAIGNYYASCMDDAAIEKTGLASLQPLLKKTSSIKNDKQWFDALIELHRAGIFVVWGASSDADLKDSTKNVLYLDSSGLGLPDRDYYFEANFKDKVVAYREHIARMFQLTKLTAEQSKLAADDVVAIEMALAKLTKTGVERRDVPGMYNPTAIAALNKSIKSVNWKSYFKALSIVPGANVVLTSPAYFAAIDSLRKAQPWSAWSHYFTYHLLRQSAFSLPKAFDDERFALDKVLNGVEVQRDRYKRCIESTSSALDNLVGQAFVSKQFAGESKTRASDMIAGIVEVMGEKIGQLDWMSAATKTTAQEKLKKLARMIGYPSAWRTYPFAIKANDFAGNRLRAAQAETKRVLSRAGKPVDRNDWLMGAYEVNAYYNPSANNTALPAGILQPPFFAKDRSVAANLGGIGMIIGHELTHGFDDQGAQFDADGNLKNWWSVEDLKNFESKGTCLADQYSTFEVQPKMFINGKLTLGENIADLGGVKMAFAALQKLRSASTSITVADGFTEPQQFFLGVGQAWCSASRKAQSEKLLKTDPHSPPKYRIYGALRNLPEFATAFQCATGTPMRPAKICSIW